MTLLMFTDILGWIGNIFFVLGAFLLAKKRPIPCCITNIVGNGIYIIVGILKKETTCFKETFLFRNCSGKQKWIENI